LRRQPHFDVVLLRRSGAELARRAADDTVREAQPAHDRLLQREDRLELVPGPIGMGEAEHLRLVELVHTEDAAGVLSVRAGLAAKARREPGVAQGERVYVDDLAAMQRRQRDLARPDEEQLAAVDLVDLRSVGGKETGLLHRVLAYQHWWDDRREALGDDASRHPLHECELEQRALAHQ